MRRQIKIDRNTVIATPNEKMWGIFYEEINHAGDGGIYGELIRNRTFADSNLPEGCFVADGKFRNPNGYEEPFKDSEPLPGWSVVPGYGAYGWMEKNEENPRNPQTPCQLMLTAMGKVRLINEGYWGIPARKTGYYGFVIARAEGVDKLKVGICRRDGTILGCDEIAVGSSFAKAEYSFDVETVDDNARFFIEADGNCKVWFDFVTMFANDTYQGEKYGFRADLVQMLKDMKPGFLRFPGGCVVEGLTLENAIHWKKTIGPIEDRPGHFDLWGYRATDGLGMLEFCKLGELLGADLMYVFNCGMSCQARQSERASEAEFAQWLQDALDGIEYICGDVTTEWGARRAADGHPEPFNLRYLEIGNENWGEVYRENYQVFYDVLREKYPNMTLISNFREPGMEYDLMDDHYYTNPRVFPTMNEKYAGEGDMVYVGEYACNSEVGYGNLLAAISEATFMTALENCADRVRIASYAPLFCNDHDRRWPVNLINFDNNHVFGLPSYYVQKLFACDTVEKVVSTDNNVVIGKSDNLYLTAGVKGDTLIIKAANFNPHRILSTFTCDGIAAGEASVSLVTGDKETDTNSLLYPEYVSESRFTIPTEDGSVNYEFAPYSFAVIRVKLA